MTAEHDRHPLRLRSRAAPIVASLTGLMLWAAAPAATAAHSHSTDDFDFDVDDLCPATFHLTVHNEVDDEAHSNGHGTTFTTHVVETDTAAANGVTVQGLPYHYTVHTDVDENGNVTRQVSSGEAWRFRLPDGSIWSAGGRNNFLTGEIVGSWQIADGLGPVCDALAG
jgi:hypothetical protein